MSSLAPKLRLVRPAPDPLGLYIRAGSIGREDLQNFIMSNGATFSGVVSKLPWAGQRPQSINT